MTAIETSAKLLSLLEAINEQSEQIIIQQGARYLNRFYQCVSENYRTLKDILGPQPQLFPIQLEAENKSLYSVTIKPIKKQLSLFVNWYLPNDTLIDTLFSSSVITDIVHSDVIFKYGKELKEAEDDYKEIIADEAVWHQLTRAYGNRFSFGRDVNSFTEEDWSYIRGPLEEFKQHFKQTKVDIPQIYEEYETIIKPRYLLCQKHLSEIQRSCEKYRRERQNVYEIDVYSKIYAYLAPLCDVLSIINNEESDIGISLQEEANEQRASTKRSATYDSLKDCAKNEIIYQTIIKIAAEYYDHHNRIDGIFGYTLFKKMGEYGLFAKGKCTQEYFGELLIKEFRKQEDGGWCSFKGGGAISDAKKTTDSQLERKIDGYLSSYRNMN